MTREVESLLKPDPVTCPCGCGMTGRAVKTRKDHVRGCPCRPCFSGRSSKKGKKLHRDLARQIGAASPSGRVTSNEEAWRGAWRVEAKTGSQVHAIYSKYYAAKAQSEQAKSYGDHRPFVFLVHRGEKGSKPLAVVELEVLQNMTLIVQEVVS
jgi:hypothetical protein